MDAGPRPAVYIALRWISADSFHLSAWFSECPTCDPSNALALCVFFGLSSARELATNGRRLGVPARFVVQSSTGSRERRVGHVATGRIGVRGAADACQALHVLAVRHRSAAGRGRGGYLA